MNGVARVNELRLAFMVLSRISTGTVGGEAPSVASSAWAWPIVGMGVGVGAALVFGLAGWAGLPPTLAAALAVGASILLTGGLHEDGLTDLCDGLGGGCDRDRALEIMRDSQIGSFGALALVLSILVRVLALGALVGHGGALAVIGVAAASRATLPWALRLMPPARADGLGRGAAGVTQGAALVAAALGFAALLPFGPWIALKAAALIAAAAALVGLWAKARLGGQTGDVLGAMQQAGELAGWLALTAMAA